MSRGKLPLFAAHDPLQFANQMFEAAAVLRLRFASARQAQVLGKQRFQSSHLRRCQRSEVDGRKGLQSQLGELDHWAADECRSRNDSVEGRPYCLDNFK